MDKVKQAVSVFDKYASQYQDKYMSYSPYVATYREFAELLDADHISVLDVACGPGGFSKYLLERNPELKVTGVDLAPQMIELARLNVPKGNFLLLDSRAVKTLDEKFDVILLGFCLPYLPKTEAVRLLADVASMINEDGLLYVSTVEGNYGNSGYQSNDHEDRIFVYFYSQQFLTKQLESHGFEIIQAKRIPFPSQDKPEAEDLFVYARKRSANVGAMR